MIAINPTEVDVHCHVNELVYLPESDWSDESLVCGGKHSVLSISIMTNGKGYDENNQDV